MQSVPNKGRRHKHATRVKQRCSVSLSLVIAGVIQILHRNCAGNTKPKPKTFLATAQLIQSAETRADSAPDVSPVFTCEKDYVDHGPPEHTANSIYRI
jgi:hypothetical protein